jgi:hypothetical protein
MFNKLAKLISKIAPWYEQKIPEARLSKDSRGRPWFLKAIGYSNELKLPALREVTDHGSLNSTYEARYDEEKVKARKGISAIKLEISALYGFRKCFVQRFKGRLHFYRDDTSQKAKRTLQCVGKSVGKFEKFKEKLDQ